MKKIILFLLTLTLVISSYAQVFSKLPDDFTEKYSSIDEYYKSQQEEEKKREEEAEAKRIAEQKAAEEQEARDEIRKAFYSNSKTKSILSYIKSFGGYFEIYSNEPYDEAYVVWRQAEDNEYSYTIWRLSVQNRECKLMSLLCLEDVNKTCRKIDEYNGSYEDFNLTKSNEKIKKEYVEFDENNPAETLNKLSDIKAALLEELYKSK